MTTGCNLTFNNLQNAVSAPSPQVYDVLSLYLGDMVDGRNMPLGDVANVNVVPDTLHENQFLSANPNAKSLCSKKRHQVRFGRIEKLSEDAIVKQCRAEWITDRAIRRGIIVAKDGKLFERPNGNLGHIRHQIVGDPVGIFPYLAALVSSDWIKVPSVGFRV
jgi:hypothetical protein